jgi:hypothetical protein
LVTIQDAFLWNRVPTEFAAPSAKNKSSNHYPGRFVPAVADSPASEAEF